MRALEDALYIERRSVYAIGLESADLNQVLDFCNCYARRGCHYGIEVSRGLSINEVAPGIALPRSDESKVRGQCFFEHVHTAVEFACFFALSDESAVARRCVISWNAGACSAHSLGERALRNKFDFELSGKRQLFEQLVLTDIGRNDLTNLMGIQEESGALPIDTRIVADDGEVLCSLVAESSDEVFRNSAEPKSTQHNGGAVLNVGDGFMSIANDLVQSDPPRLNNVSISSKSPASIESRIR